MSSGPLSPPVRIALAAHTEAVDSYALSGPRAHRVPASTTQARARSARSGQQLVGSARAVGVEVHDRERAATLQDALADELKRYRRAEVGDPAVVPGGIDQAALGVEVPGVKLHALGIVAQH